MCIQRDSCRLYSAVADTSPSLCLHQRNVITPVSILMEYLWLPKTLAESNAKSASHTILQFLYTTMTTKNRARIFKLFCDKSLNSDGMTILLSQVCSNGQDTRQLSSCTKAAFHYSNIAMPLQPHGWSS